MKCLPIQPPEIVRHHFRATRAVLSYRSLITRYTNGEIGFSILKNNFLVIMFLRVMLTRLIPVIFLTTKTINLLFFKSYTTVHAN